MKVKAGEVASLDLFVKLDGELVQNCLEADDVEGYVIVMVLEEDGLPKADENGDLQTERIDGTVELVSRTEYNPMR